MSLVGAVVMVAACSRAPPQPAPQTRPVADNPREVLARLIELRSARKYLDLPALIVPQQGGNVVDFLLAVDDFLSANGRLCNWLRDHGAVGLAQIIDQAYVADDLSVYAGEDLGLFSRHVELLDVSVRADEAVVSFIAGDQLPAKQAHLRMVDGAWRYDPGRGHSAHLSAAFHDLARGLDLVLADLENGRIPDAELRGNPERLLEKVQARLRRGVNLLSKAQAAAAGSHE